MEKTEKTAAKGSGIVLKGMVVSDKMKNTVVVEVSRYAKHSKYKKYRLTTKRYKAHDEGNSRKVGEVVEIIECRPISRDKKFRVINKS